MNPNHACSVWKSLNGIICVYKPAETGFRFIKESVKNRLCEGLNELKVRDPYHYLTVGSTDLTVKNADSSDVVLSIQRSFADNVKAVGPRYQPNDIGLFPANILTRKMSGVVVLGLNDGSRQAGFLNRANLIRVYQLKGVLGQACKTLFPNSHIKARANYTNAKRSVMDTTCASFQAAHQRKMFVEAGVNLQTQEAYELAVKGLIRPTGNYFPVIYSLKCTHFKPPNFTLEVHCLNETEDYFLTLVHDIGLKLKTFATCTEIRCLRYGCFTIKDALLIKHLNPENVIKNMELCRNLLKENVDIVKEVLQPIARAKATK